MGPEAGQPFGHTNWGGIEPNNNGYLYMNIGTPYAGISPGAWVDDSGVNGVPESGPDPVIGFFVEYEGASSAVPDNATRSRLLLVPNPAQAAVTVSYALSASGRARVTVHAADGRRVALLSDGDESAGWHVRAWSGLDDTGRRPAPGIYFVRVDTSRESFAQKLLLLP